MSCTTEIRANEAHFKLARKMLDVLASKFSFSLEDAWKEVCSTPQEGLLKKFKRDRQQSNPYKDITRARTSFSLFTMERRAGIVAQNPGADFVAVSKLVSKAWNSLSDAEKQVYKDKEFKDKDRYKTECAAVVIPVSTPAPVVSTPTEAPTTPKASSAKKPKSAAAKKTASATPVPAVAAAPSPATPATPAPAVATPKKPVGKKTKAEVVAPVAVPVAAVAVAPVEAVKKVVSKAKPAKKAATPSTTA